MKHPTIRKPQIERLSIWFTILATGGMVAAHLIAAIVRRFVPELPLAAWPITFGAIGLAAAVTLAAPRFARVLPEWLDGSARAHPAKAALFALIALTAIVQTARLSAHMTDQSTSWWILTTNEDWSKHECGTAYFHAAELNDRGEKNIYHADCGQDGEPNGQTFNVRFSNGWMFHAFPLP